MLSARSCEHHAMFTHRKQNDAERCRAMRRSSHGIGEGETNVVVADGAYAHRHQPLNEYNIMK